MKTANKGDLVELKNDDARKQFPSVAFKIAEVTSVSMMPGAFKVRFQGHRHADTWSPEYFRKARS